MTRRLLTPGQELIAAFAAGFACAMLLVALV